MKRRKDRERKLVGRVKVLARVRDILSRCYPCFVWICRCTFASYRRVLHRQWTIRRCALQYAAAPLLPIALNLVCIGFFKYRKILYGWTPDKRRFYTFRFSKYPRARAAGKKKGKEMRNGNSQFQQSFRPRDELNHLAKVQLPWRSNNSLFRSECESNPFSLSRWADETIRFILKVAWNRYRFKPRFLRVCVLNLSFFNLYCKRNLVVQFTLKLI